MDPRPQFVAFATFWGRLRQATGPHLLRASARRFVEGTASSGERASRPAGFPWCTPVLPGRPRASAAPGDDRLTLPPAGCLSRVLLGCDGAAPGFGRAFAGFHRRGGGRGGPAGSEGPRNAPPERIVAALRDPWAPWAARATADRRFVEDSACDRARGAAPTSGRCPDGRFRRAAARGHRRPRPPRRIWRTPTPGGPVGHTSIPLLGLVLGAVAAVTRPPGPGLTSAIQHFAARAVVAEAASEIPVERFPCGRVLAARRPMPTRGEG